MGAEADGGAGGGGVGVALTGADGGGAGGRRRVTKSTPTRTSNAAMGQRREVSVDIETAEFCRRRRRWPQKSVRGASHANDAATPRAQGGAVRLRELVDFEEGGARRAGYSRDLRRVSAGGKIEDEGRVGARGPEHEGTHAGGGVDNRGGIG